MSAESIAHQDSAGLSGSPLGVFADGALVEVVPASDRSGDATRRRVVEQLGRTVEILIICPRHPATAAVDCLVCVPEDAT